MKRLVPGSSDAGDQAFRTSAAGWDRKSAHWFHHRHGPRAGTRVLEGVGGQCLLPDQARQQEAEVAARTANLAKQRGFYVDRDEGDTVLSPTAIPAGTTEADLRPRA
ncbi:hypothetical protein [Streptomyces sp. NPDC001809]